VTGQKLEKAEIRRDTERKRESDRREEPLIT